MTFERIMEIFKEQFEIDKDMEVVKFRRGYQIFIWDDKKQAYIPNAELIYSEEQLVDELIKETKMFYGLKQCESDNFIERLIKNLKDENIFFS